MIAEGIQNPTTGEIVKVQGAGTVYNEEKNSIAIGSGTIASGQDQFVFGRSNVADAGKTEVVGGGRRGYTIGEKLQNDWDGGGIWYGGESYADLKKCINIATGVPEENISILSLIELSQINGVNYTEEELSREIAEDELECFLFHWSQGRMTWNVHWKNNGWPSTDYIAINGYVYAPSTIDQSSNISFVKADNYYISKSNKFGDSILNNIGRKNIRTLDWQGNQWNAGDVTCDDGEGNTISLRDLASHKANVYETENIEALDGTVIEKLKSGDIIIKKGENSNHAYRVSFKNATGMCLTYADAENVETIAYDKTGDTWAKTDKTVTGITGKADANHNHDTAYAALNHNHDDAYAAKTHSHAIADVTGLQAALDNKMRAQKSLKITYASATQTFAIDSAQSAALNSFTASVPENTWIPVRIELYEDSTKEGDVFGFAMWELAGQDDEYDVTVMINNVKFFTFAQESSQTFTFDSWSRSFVGQSFFS